MQSEQVGPNRRRHRKVKPLSGSQSNVKLQSDSRSNGAWFTHWYLHIRTRKSLIPPWRKLTFYLKVWICLWCIALSCQLLKLSFFSIRNCTVNISICVCGLMQKGLKQLKWWKSRDTLNICGCVKPEQVKTEERKHWKQQLTLLFNEGCVSPAQAAATIIHKTL